MTGNYKDGVWDMNSLINGTVLVFDICSSTKIVDNLNAHNRVGEWRDLLLKLQDFLTNSQTKMGFNLYKFTGDGWIIIFEGGNWERNIVQLIWKLMLEYNKLFILLKERHLGID